jgi:hypothetical protein
MVLKGVCGALFCAMLLAWNSPSRADEYRPDEFLKLDLSQAALSPKPLGPPTQFEPLAVEAKADPAVTVVPVRKAKQHIAAQTKRNVAVQTRLVRKHTNPLDAQAFDARIQVWPCKSGGICNWRR